MREDLNRHLNRHLDRSLNRLPSRQLYQHLHVRGDGSTYAVKSGAATWARDRVIGGVDSSIRQLVEDSTEVSDEVSKAITEVCARWVKVNRLMAKVARDYPVNELEPKDIAIAYVELKRCAELLDQAIGPDLRAARDLAGA